MEQSRRSNYAAVMDAQIKPSKEECAGGMERNEISYCAAVMDVQIKPREEESVLHMEQVKRRRIVSNLTIETGRQHPLPRKRRVRKMIENRQLKRSRQVVVQRDTALNPDVHVLSLQEGCVIVMILK
jgi:hypothetical protein